MKKLIDIPDDIIKVLKHKAVDKNLPLTKLITKILEEAAKPKKPR